MITDSKLFKGLMSENENLKELLEENNWQEKIDNQIEGEVEDILMSK